MSKKNQEFKVFAADLITFFLKTIISGWYACKKQNEKFEFNFFI